MDINEFDKKVAHLFQLRAEKDAMEAKVTEKNKEINTLKGELVNTLKELDRKDYSSPSGTISIKTVWSVTTPKTDDDKKSLFNWLTEKGWFYQYATVNSQSLNSLYRKEFENAKDKGMGLDFGIPGVGQPKAFESLNVRSKGEKHDDSGE